MYETKWYLLSSIYGKNVLSADFCEIQGETCYVPQAESIAKNQWQLREEMFTF